MSWVENNTTVVSVGILLQFASYVSPLNGIVYTGKEYALPWTSYLVPHVAIDTFQIASKGQ